MNMTIHVTMKDGTTRAYDGVQVIMQTDHYHPKLLIQYYTAHSSLAVAELKLNAIKSFSYGL